MERSAGELLSNEPKRIHTRRHAVSTSGFLVSISGLLIPILAVMTLRVHGAEALAGAPPYGPPDIQQVKGAISQVRHLCERMSRWGLSDGEALACQWPQLAELIVDQDDDKGGQDILGIVRSFEHRLRRLDLQESLTPTTYALIEALKKPSWILENPIDYSVLLLQFQAWNQSENIVGYFNRLRQLTGDASDLAKVKACFFSDPSIRENMRSFKGRFAIALFREVDFYRAAFAQPVPGQISQFFISENSEEYKWTLSMVDATMSAHEDLPSLYVKLFPIVQSRLNAPLTECQALERVLHTLNWDQDDVVRTRLQCERAETQGKKLDLATIAGVKSVAQDIRYVGSKQSLQDTSIKRLRELVLAQRLSILIEANLAEYTSAARFAAGLHEDLKKSPDLKGECPVMWRNALASQISELAQFELLKESDL